MTLLSAPQRIVSLVPSITELLVDLGLEEQLVGVTKFCVHPDRIRKDKTIVGGTKNIDIERVINLEPDLIIANKEENQKAQVELLKEKCPVYVSDVNTRHEALHLVESLGIALGKRETANHINKQLNKQSLLSSTDELRVLYLIWRKPYMAAGGDTYISSMLSHIGYTNCTAALQRYPELTEAQIRELDPDIVMLSSEPYPFATKHIHEMEAILPSARIILVDGEAFSWYGTRELKIGNYFEELKAQII